MRQGSIRLGKVLGVPLSMDLGVVVIGGLLTWGLAAIILPNGAPGLVSSVYWTVGIVGALLFLGSLLAHELAHAVVARRNEVEVEGITLWLFGGFAQFGNEPRTPGAEFRITAAGPATSLGLGAVFLAMAFGLAQLGVPVVYTTMLAWLGIINGFLGVFNLIPGAPLDGGRILAAALWRIRGDRVSGRIGAASVGKFVGGGLIGLGLFELVVLQGFTGLWTILIGWFLFNAARMEHTHFVGRRALGALTVGEAMGPMPETVTTWTSVADLVEGALRRTSRPTVAVVDWQGRVVGVVGMDAVRRLPAEQWPTTDVVDIATSGDAIAVASPYEQLTDALERVGSAGGAHVVVEHDGRSIGFIGPDEVRRAIELGRLRGPRPSTVMPPPPPGSVPNQRWDPPLHTS